MTAVNATRTWRTRKSLALPGRVSSYFVHDGDAAPGWTTLRFPDKEPDCQVHPSFSHRKLGLFSMFLPRGQHRVWKYQRSRWAADAESQTQCTPLICGCISGKRTEFPWL